jgi:hypothetical protein
MQGLRSRLNISLNGIVSAKFIDNAVMQHFIQKLISYFLMGTAGITLLGGSSLQAQVLEISGDANKTSGEIRKGAVTASITQNRHVSSGGYDVIQGVVTVKVNGKIVGQLLGAESSSVPPTVPPALLQIVELDPSNPYPEVLLSSYTGGAHCCNKTNVLTSDASGNKWKEVVAKAGNGSFFDANPEPAADPTKSGRYVIVNRDNRFNYQFSSYASSMAPTQIWQLNGDRFVDVSRRPEYQFLYRRQVKEMNAWLKRRTNKFEINGFLAGYVATKALLGEFAEGWKQMLKYYDDKGPNSDWGLTDCPAGYDNNNRCKGREIVYDSFPQALRAFLIQTGYIKSSDSVSLSSNSSGSSRNPSPPQSQSQSSASLHQGYCTFLPAAGFGEKIVNDRCQIEKINNNAYQLIWSNGRSMSITLNPASIDGNGGQLIYKTATAATVKTNAGRVGYCWNCKP